MKIFRVRFQSQLDDHCGKHDGIEIYAPSIWYMHVEVELPARGLNWFLNQQGALLPKMNTAGCELVWLDRVLNPKRATVVFQGHQIPKLANAVYGGDARPAVILVKKLIKELEGHLSAL